MRTHPTAKLLTVATWSFDNNFWAARTLGMGAVALFPVALASMFQLAASAGVKLPVTGFGAFSLLTAMVSFHFVAPVLALAYSSGIVSDEAEAATLTYLITRPVRRLTLLTGKMVASFALQLVLLIPSMVLTFYIAVAPAGWQEIGRRFPALGADTGIAILGVAAYSGLFALLGTVLRRPVLVGLFFVFGWQSAATYIPGLVQRLTVAYYLQCLLPHESFQGDLSRLWAGAPTALASISTLLLISLGTHALAAWVFSRKEFTGRAAS